MIDLDNIRTSVSGLILAVGVAGVTVEGVPEKHKWIFGILAAVGSVGLGFNAKDRTNHSTFAQVEEATQKAETKAEEEKK